MLNSTIFRQKQCHLSMFKLRYLSLVFPVLLAACSSGGSFDTEDTTPPINNKPTINETSNNPLHDDNSDQKVPEEELDEFNQPTIGFVAKIVNPTKAYPVKDDATLSYQSLLSFEELSTIPNNEQLEALKESHLQEDNGYPITQIFNSNDKTDLSKTRDQFNYINSGFAYYQRTSMFHKGPNGYIFYKGINPSSSLPTASQDITYNGTWDYVSNTQKTNKKSSINYKSDMYGMIYAGKSFAAFSGEEKGLNTTNADNPIGLSSEFNVNFSDKTLTGKLIANKEEQHANGKTYHSEDRYTLSADIYGNRFRGTTTASNKESAFFKSDGILEGGFFGPNAEELAGKFLANDNSLVGVFGAKREDNTLSSEKILDALTIGKEDEDQQTLNNFGVATKLYIDGKEINLVENGQDLNKVDIFGDGTDKNGVNVRSCCSNLDYLKYGQLDKAGKNFVFLQGERTPTANMPATGNVEYQGSWSGYIDGFPFDGKGENDGQQANTSHFNVEFDSKRIAGQLFDSRGNKAVEISADIKGNGFSGNAHIDNYQLDPKAESGASQISFNQDQLKVQGGFYGKTASELGGAISGKNTNNKHTNIVFGAKRQTKDSQ